MNMVCIMGRFTSDPELRYTDSGTKVITFTLAVPRGYHQESKTDFLDCVAWRGAAEFIDKYFRKGQMCAVAGQLQTRTWVSQDGQNRKAVEIIVSNIDFCGGKNQQKEQQSDTINGLPAMEFQDISDTDDGDMPF